MAAAEATPVVALRPAVAWVGAVSAGSSGIALVAAILTGSPLWMSSTFVFVPGLVAFTALTVAARRGRTDQQALFLARVRTGALAGLLGTAAYDLSRFAVEATNLSSSNTFVAIRMFGAGLTGLPPTTAGAQVAGWAFHMANGLGFALAYTLIFAGRRWAWGVLFALGLEAAMVALYPRWLGTQLTTEFLSVSVMGHVAYGSVLGAMAQRTP